MFRSILMLVATLIGLLIQPAFAADEKINLRQINVLDTDTVVHLWETVDEMGQATPWYEITREGKSFVRQTSYQIKLRHGNFDPGNAVPPPLWPSLASSPQQQLYLVQFQTQSLVEYRQALSELGAHILHFLPYHTHVVKMDPGVRDVVQQLAFVRWVGPYHPAYRLEEYMLHNANHGYDFFPLQKYNIGLFESHQFVKNELANRIVKLGGVVNRAHAGKFLMEATLNPDQLFEVARWDEVMFIDRWSPGGADMDIAREFGGADYLEMVEGFTGEGVRGEVIDIGFNDAHVDFQSRPLIGHTAYGTDSHGAATSGICFGDGTGDPTARGLLPAGQGMLAAWSEVSVGQPRYDHTGELVEAPYFAVFQTSSVGSAQITEYSNVSMDTDAALFDFDIVHCQSQSNTGNRNSRPQAWAKNIISGGAVNHQNTLDRSDDCWCGGASIGPAQDGRIKPDLSAFYDSIRTTTSGGTTAYTNSFGGTSGATPIICGHVGLVFQMWHEGVFGNPVDGATVFDNRAHMTTAKALLINSATQYEFTGTGHDLTRVHQGWGTPNLQTLYDNRDNMVVIDETTIIDNMATVNHYVEVGAGQAEFKATMIYADPPGMPSASQHRINDLTLRVTDPNGVVYWGNNGLVEGNYSTPGGDPNDYDTVENVFVQNPPTGEWEVSVIAMEINQDSHLETPELDADFALVVSGGILAPGFSIVPSGINGSVCAPDDHVFTLGFSEVPPFSDPVTLSASLPSGLTANYSQNPVTLPATVTVTLSNTAGAGPGTHPFTITANGGGLERETVGILAIADMIPIQPDGLVPANGAQDISLTPDFSWDATAQANTYDIEVATDENFANIIHSSNTTQTSLAYSGALLSLSEYFWRVRAVNDCGVGSWTSQCFVTIEHPDYFTEQFSSFDLDNTTLFLIPDGSGDFYDACQESAVGLPTDPSGSANLGLSDDDFAEVALAQMVSLYGSNYGTIFVGSNGYVTLNSGSTDTSETIAEHFGQPRVSGLYDDLNPATGGSVTVTETGDRVAVTWMDVPEFNTSNSNTFQIEFLFNGEVHITWLGMDAIDGLCGISAGGGTPPAFLESDLSNYNACETVNMTIGGVPCSLCVGDLTGDGMVDAADLGIAFESWRSTGGATDLNGDGLTDSRDLIGFYDLVGTSCD